MWVDPIVAEVCRTREEFAAVFDFDGNPIFADLRKHQAALGTRLVSPKKQLNQTLPSNGAARPASQDPKLLETRPDAKL